MTTENSQLQRVQGNTPAFLRDATSTLEKMQSYAKLLADSELLPKHFYKLDQFKKPIKDAQGNLQPNTPAIIMTIQHGLEIGMSISQALQQIVPINGVVSVKGDGAMALIQNSGLCVFWKEEITGTIENEDYTIKLHAKHKNGREKVIEFSVSDAKRLGLWVTEGMVQKDERLKHGGWWKTPKRMIAYRALGYMARDLFPEVMQGMYTEEEARDFETDNTVTILSNGMQVSTSTYTTTKGQALNDEVTKAIAESASVVEPKSRKPRVPKSAPAEEVKTDETPLPVVPVSEPVNETSPELPPEEPKPNALALPYRDVELQGMQGVALLEVLSSIIGNDANVVYFDKHPDKRKKSNIIKLILAAQDGMLPREETVIFGSAITGEPKPSQPQSDEPKSENGDTPIKNYGQIPRSFDDKMVLLDELEELGYGPDVLDARIKALALPYKDNEDFLSNANNLEIHLVKG